MNCRDAEALVDRQIDGDLSPAEIEILSEHISRCASCTRVAARAAAEQRLFEQFSAALHDRPPVWPAVRMAIRREAPPERPTWNWRKIFWLGVPAIAGSLLFSLLLFRPDRSAHLVDTSPQTATLEAQARYLRAIETVRQDVFAHLAQLPAGAADSLTASLAELDATIASASDAWRTNPDDPLASRYLLSAYAHKLDLLMRFVTAS